MMTVTVWTINISKYTRLKQIPINQKEVDDN